MAANKFESLLHDAETALAISETTVAQLVAGLITSGPFAAGKSQPAKDRVTTACRVIERLKNLKGELERVIADVQERMGQLASAQGLSVPDDCGA
ncbi:hypothetical protein C4587_02165 [Candidatus Parcubacteria bacterium]|nr:MAG: hypothetical protein C4587_02165 [Candidatus Parcubacteria bacterium]